MTRSMLAVMLLLVAAPVALAGPVESPGGSDIKPGDDDVRVIRYDYSGGGLLLSDDGGETFRLMCGLAIDASIRRETTTPVIAADGSMYVGTFDAMWRGSADGCDWEKVDAFEGKWVKDVVRHPTDPAVVLAVTSNGGDVDNGIYRLDPADGTWTAVGTQEPVLIRALRIISLDGGGVRFYESIARGTRPDGRSPNYLVRFSDDEGVTWTEHEVGDVDGTLALLDVDPTDPDRIAVSITSESEQDRVWISETGGATDSWIEVMTPEEFGGGAFGPEGQLWLGDHQAGLFVVTAGADAAELLNDELKPRCVEYDAEQAELFVCGLLDAGTVDVDSGDFTQLIDFRTHDLWLECDGESVAPLCQSDLGLEGWCGPTHFPEAPICEAYGFPGVTDGGDGDSDGDGDGGDGDGPDAGTGDDDDSGCGCRAVGGRHDGGGPTSLAVLALLATALRLRRRRG